MVNSEIIINIVEVSSLLAEELLDSKYEELSSLELYDLIYNKLKELEIKN